MPNRLGYCGGTDAAGLFERCTAGLTSPELDGWAATFEGAYPYLALIAGANGLPDPLDARVVEAYWIGNELLDGVSMAPLHASLRERFGPRLSPKTLELILGKVPAGARPHHSFHVIDICRRTGALAESLEMLDSCRISWGRVLTVDGAHLEVQVQPLEFREGRLALGDAETRRVLRSIDDKGFLEDARIGDWVSIHWGWACDRLSARQIENLRRYTAHHLAIANPAQIIELDSDRALVRYEPDGGAHLAEVARPPGLAAEVGDWVLVHAGLMIGRIPADEVDALLELSRSIQPGL
jgi:hydrogenase maturation factor